MYEVERPDSEECESSIPLPSRVCVILNFLSSILVRGDIDTKLQLDQRL
jgi:hypothetical protein